MNKTVQPTPEDDFIEPVMRAFRRVARKLRAENARLGLPLVQSDDGDLRLMKLDSAASRR